MTARAASSGAPEIGMMAPKRRLIPRIRDTAAAIETAQVTNAMFVQDMKTLGQWPMPSPAPVMGGLDTIGVCGSIAALRRPADHVEFAP